jgi:glycosyltransferase involved in cell wall biosynthesis
MRPGPSPKHAEIPHDLVDEVILCDDASRDNTVETALQLGIEHVIRHEQNRGYGGNQTLYKKALEINGDIVIMLHRLPVHATTDSSMVNIIGENLYPVVLGSRILGKGTQGRNADLQVLGQPVSDFFSDDGQL